MVRTGGPAADGPWTVAWNKADHLERSPLAASGVGPEP